MSCIGPQPFHVHARCIWVAHERNYFTRKDYQGGNEVCTNYSVYMCEGVLDFMQVGVGSRV